MIKSKVLEKIRTAISIPKAIDTDDEVFLDTLIDGDDVDERKEQRTSIVKKFGGGPRVNIGGGGNREQC